MADLARLRHERSQCEKTITRVVKYFEGLDTESLDEGTIAQLKLRLNTLEPAFNEFSKIQSEIEYLLDCKEDEPLQNIRHENQLRDNFENTYFDLVVKIKTVISKTETVSDSHSSINKAVDNYQNSPQFTMNSKLPALKLPTFSGVTEKWLEFRDIFISLVENNNQLDEIQKFYYLRSCLEGEAAQLVESIPITSDNYDVAWTSLKNRYENKRLIVFTYVKTLFDIPAVYRENCNDLRNLYDTFTKCTRSLENLGQPVNTWDTLLVHLIVSKFDNRTRRDWESYKIQKELPTMQELNKFLKEKCELLEKINISRLDNKADNLKNKNKIYNKNQNTYSLVANQEKTMSCYFCKNNHPIFKCDKFMELNVFDKRKEVQKLKLCFNCFNPDHMVNECTKTSCKKCHKKHNTLLHAESVNTNTSPDIPTTVVMRTEVQPAKRENVNPDNKNSHHICQTETTKNIIPDGNIAMNSATAGGAKNSLVLLSTAIVNVHDKKGKIIPARLLLDPGSQSNFVTEQLINLLNLDKTAVNYTVSGVGHNITMSQFKVSLKIASRCNDYTTEISCLVLPKITQGTPTYSFDSSCLQIPKEKVLADPTFNKHGQIDILCGIGLFYDLLLMEQLKLNNGLIVQKTRLGWVLGGEINYLKSDHKRNVVSYFCTNNYNTESEINDSLSKFWQVEECLTDIKKNNPCERHFVDNSYRGTDGHFVVKIPFSKNISELGSSEETALQRFNYLEKKLAKNDNLKRQYVQFMNEYEKLGHMKELPITIEKLKDDGSTYYVPHHAVLKDSSSTTPCRVVFDFSAKTDKGTSLNDIQYTGPVIQSDLFDILLRFRQYKFILSADISKMYRQVWLNPEHTRFQRIFWRSTETCEIKCYELLTVTYGMAASSYLATRPMIQLAEENKIKFPRASQSIKESFYVDDYLDGANDENDLINLQLTVSKILNDAGFQLRKWLTNQPQLFDKFSTDEKIESSILNLGENQNNKTLGIFWNSNSDTIEFKVKSFDNQAKITKRSILSIIGQIFDPLGLISPIIVKAKMILQLIWKEKVEWDETVSDSLQQKWLSFITDLRDLAHVKVPRICLIVNACFYELHIFVDASEKAYGACIYVRSNFNNKYSCHLLCSKSKVAPIKQLSLPRLELCAAVLGAKLANKVKNILNLKAKKIYYWTDSLVTYHWIQGSSDRWKTFVANRVSTIQNMSASDEWHHVSSKDNPADIISRGTTAENLRTNCLWFNGPAWLQLEESEWPNSGNISLLNSIPEQRLLLHAAVVKNDLDIFHKHSNLRRLKRITAYCLRFLFNTKNPKSKRTGALTIKEINDSFHLLIKISQEQSFESDIIHLKKHGIVSNSSNVLKLRPFLDSDSIIRVGGRISKAQLSFNKMHPILLCKNHPLTKLIMTYEHQKLLHCGPQQLLYTIREKFWPLSGRDIARSVVHNCITCFKARPRTIEAIMGNLPAERLNPCFPFTNVGCDYGGPFYIKDRKTRKPLLSKAWFCIFVCMVTKAIHIELVSNLSTDSFLACFKRFVARRGKPSIIFCDNGTQLVGAKNELLHFIQNDQKTSQYFIDEEITWKFIPPVSPNFGGIWEAGVKSIKYHVKRIIGNNNLHFDEFCTLLCQIEAILNSRPLSPLSSSPDDYSPLTPGHFLIGRALTSLPEPNYVPIPQNRLNLYEGIQKMVQLFWKRWNREYIGELQTRLKWNKNYEQLLQIGSLVLVKDDSTPPMRWKMARVIQLHPGDDKIVRVVLVKFSDGSVLKRSVRKLCLLPV